MVVFQQLHAKNFLSLGDITLDFVEGLWLVKGENLDNSKSKSNGAGKSNLFAAIPYAIYGETSKGKTADSVVNDVAQQNCSVTLTFTSGGKSYRIERYRKHKKFKNALKFFVDGEDVTEQTQGATQKKIDKVFGVDLDMFTSIIVLAQGLKSRFSELKETGRRELIQGLRNNLIWDKCRELTKKELALFKKTLETTARDSSTTQALLQTRKQDLRQLADQMTTLQSALRDAESDTNTSGLTTTIQQLESEIASLQQKKTTEMESAATAQPQVTELQNQMRTESEKVFPLKNRLDFLIKRIQHPETKCPTCNTVLQRVTEDEIHSYREEESRLRGEIQTLDLRVLELKQQAEEINRKASEVYASVRTTDTEIQRRSQQISQLRNDLSVLESRASNLQSQMAQLQNRHTQLSEEARSHAEKFLALQEKQKGLEQETFTYEQLESIFSPKGIQAFLLAKDIEFLNTRLALYSEYLFSSETVYLDSGLGDDGTVSKLQILIQNAATGKTKEYTDRSGGEQRRIDIAIQFALRDLVLEVSAITCNLLVLDEVFEGLDYEGIVFLLDMVKDLLGVETPTYIITHVTDLPYDQFAGNISLIKEGDITRLQT